MSAFPGRWADCLLDSVRALRGHYVDVYDPERLAALRVFLTALWVAAFLYTILA